MNDSEFRRMNDRGERLKSRLGEMRLSEPKPDPEAELQDDLPWWKAFALFLLAVLGSEISCLWNDFKNWWRKL